MELRHLRYFATVVECGSMTAAAQRLHMSQPPLSVAIGKLEQAVGAQLLVRTSRGVEPTSAGRYLLEASGRILADVDDVTRALGRFGEGLTGTVTVAAVPTLMWHRMPRLLRSFAESTPGVQVRLSDPPPWTAIDLLTQRRADVAAIMVADARRFAARHADTLQVTDWGAIPLVAALPLEYADAPDPLPVAAFEGEPLVLPTRTAAVPSLPEAVEALLAEHGVTPKAMLTAETIQTSIPMVEAGLAHAILPDPDRTTLRRFDVVVRRLEPKPRGLRALVLQSRTVPPNPLVARLLQALDQTA